MLGDVKFSKRRKMDIAELKAFLGFKILMAMNHLPSINDCWRCDPLLRYSPVADHISRDRFRELSRYLHSTNDIPIPQGTPGHDRLREGETAHRLSCFPVFRDVSATL